MKMNSELLLKLIRFLNNLGFKHLKLMMHSFFTQVIKFIRVIRTRMFTNLGLVSPSSPEIIPIDTNAMSRSDSYESLPVSYMPYKEEIFPLTLHQTSINTNIHLKNHEEKTVAVEKKINYSSPTMKRLYSTESLPVSYMPFEAECDSNHLSPYLPIPSSQCEEKEKSRKNEKVETVEKNASFPPITTSSSSSSSPPSPQQPSMARSFSTESLPLSFMPPGTFASMEDFLSTPTSSLESESNEASMVKEKKNNYYRSMADNIISFVCASSSKVMACATVASHVFTITEKPLFHKNLPKKNETKSGYSFNKKMNDLNDVKASPSFPSSSFPSSSPSSPSFSL